MNHPERLGKYQITGVLGEGAMGVVYRGFDPDIRRVVALKTIRHVGGQDAETVARSAARFRNEAQAAGRLLHPGIVGVYDFGDDGRVAYIAMEYVEGHTLALYLAHFQSQTLHFPDADIASLGLQLLEGLGHAHEHGVWHRDIKPSNVIITQSGKAKIADFGIARTETGNLTMANSVLGTPMYMAPEQFMGHPIDHRVDLYGVGVVLYQLVAGRAPFVGSHEALMYKVVNEVPAPASQADSGGRERSAAFDEVIARALAKNPRERFSTANSFAQALALALGRQPPSALSSETVFALPKASDYAPTERIPAPPSAQGSQSSLGSHGSTSAHPPTNWDPSVLAQVEGVLARHVGPLAKVMVRRAARECHDLPQLWQRLGEQITQASARAAFLAQAQGGTGGSGGASASPAPGPGSAMPPTVQGLGPGSGTGLGGRSSIFMPTGNAPAPGNGGLAAAPLSDTQIEQAQRLLAARLGPIAQVVVKRARERTRQRGAFFAALAEAVPEAAARQKLLDELERL